MTEDRSQMTDDRGQLVRRSLPAATVRQHGEGEEGRTEGGSLPAFNSHNFA